MYRLVETIYETNSFPNAWARAIEKVSKHKQWFEFGSKVKGKDQIERKHAIDSDMTFVIEGNALQEAIDGVLHPNFPTKEKHKEAYILEWDRGYDYKKQGFDYNYENRCESYSNYLDGCLTIDQWKFACEDLAAQILMDLPSNRNVIVIGNPFIDRIEIPDSPPCLREIWFRYDGIDDDGKAKIIVKTYWRSRDGGNAWMTNVIGFLKAAMREVVEPNNGRIVQYVDRSASFHVYHWDIEAMKKVNLVPVDLSKIRAGPKN